MFLDSDCVPTQTTITGYITNLNESVAYASNINIVTDNILSNYYRTQQILIPPKVNSSSDVVPAYLITANCLIAKVAFIACGGFDESFQKAGGEDIDLAFRLLQISKISYQSNSIALHSFDDGFIWFIKRFYRYGIGNYQISEKHSIQLIPKPFLPHKLTLVNIVLAFMQFVSMSIGYYSKKYIKISRKLL